MSFELRRNPRPRVAARSKWERIEALLRNRAFLVDYAAARAGWHEGATVGVSHGHVLVAAVCECADRGVATRAG